MNNKPVFIYIVFGVLTTLISFTLFIFLNNFISNPFISNNISNIFAMLFSYTVNKVFVFKSKFVSFKLLLLELFRFYSLRFMFSIIESLLILVLVSIGFSNLKSKIILFLPISLFNFFACKFIVFKAKTPS
jgi:putative flippase GtrA